MTRAVQFNFCQYDYRLNVANFQIEAIAKGQNRGRTDETIKKLFELHAAKLPVVQIVQIKAFISQLSDHLKAALYRKYWIFSYLIIFFGCSPLGTLKRLFDSFEALYQENLPHLAKTILESPPERALDVESLSNVVGQRGFLEALEKRGKRLQRLVARYRQLEGVGNLSDAARMELAFLLEISKPFTPHYKKKEPFCHSILRDEKGFYIELKSKSPYVNERGTAKKVTAAIFLADGAGAANLIAQATTFDNASEITLAAVRREFQLVQELKGVAGIWPTISLIEHVKIKEGQQIPKISQFLPLADGHFSEQVKHLSFKELLSVTKSLLLGLDALHSRKLVHADIKGSNALIKRQGDGSISAGWIDFGCTFSPFQDKTPLCFEWGHYGTHSYTPPEVFGVKGFRGDFYKADVWALGIMLYRRYLKREACWSELLNHPKGTMPQEETREEMKRRVREEIEEGLKRHLLKSDPTKMERFAILIYQMMRLKPTDRIDVKGALKELDRINSL